MGWRGEFCTYAVVVDQGGPAMVLSVPWPVPHAGRLDARRHTTELAHLRRARSSSVGHVRRCTRAPALAQDTWQHRDKTTKAVRDDRLCAAHVRYRFSA